MEKSGTLATGNDQYLFAPTGYGWDTERPGRHIPLCGKGWRFALFYSQTHGDLPTTAYAIQGSMIGRAGGNGLQGDGISENISFTLNTIDRHAVCMVAVTHTYIIPNGTEKKMRDLWKWDRNVDVGVV